MKIFGKKLWVLNKFGEINCKDYDIFHSPQQKLPNKFHKINFPKISQTKKFNKK
jgi:hypothetical protein